MFGSRPVVDSYHCCLLVYTASMGTLSLALVLLSAFSHSAWNLLLKRSGNQEVFAWALLVSGSVLLAPMGGILFWLNPVEAPGYWLALASAVTHVAYFALLGRAYSQGDLSLVYPIARGVGPMLVPVIAVLTLGESVALPAVIGITLIVGGIFMVSWWGRFRKILTQPSVLIRDGGVRYAILTGLAITLYTLIDKVGVDHVQPFLYMYMINVGAAIGLAPYIVFRHGMAPVRREWQSNALPIVTASLLVFFAYGLVLTAFSLSRVSYVAPAREVGIVFGVLLGVLVLKERFGQGRLLGSTLIVLGLILIALFP